MGLLLSLIVSLTAENRKSLSHAAEVGSWEQQGLIRIEKKSPSDVECLCQWGLFLLFLKTKTIAGLFASHDKNRQQAGPVEPY